MFNKKYVRMSIHSILSLFLAVCISSGCDGNQSMNSQAPGKNELQSRSEQADNILISEISEFDNDFDDWDYYPQFIGGGKTPGWAIVTNDQENAVKCNTTGTKYTYYWKLTKKFDLTNTREAEFKIKFHFKKHQYEFFKIQIGNEEAKNLSDFTDLAVFTEATEEPLQSTISLNDYQGKIVTIQLILKKPYDVIERKIGLYVHSAGIQFQREAVPDGTMRWVYDGNANRQLYNLVTYNNKLYGSCGTVLYIFNLDGTVYATVDVEKRIDLFAIGSNGYIYAVRRYFHPAMPENATGYLTIIKPDLSFQTTYFTDRACFDSIAIGNDGKVYIAAIKVRAGTNYTGKFYYTYSDYVYEFDSEGALINIHTVHSTNLKSYRRSMSQIILGNNDNIYLVTLSGAYAINKTDMSYKWKIPYGISASDVHCAIGHDDVLYVSRNVNYIASNPSRIVEEAHLQAISPDGTVIWEYVDPKGNFSGNGIVIGKDGTVFIGFNRQIYLTTYLYAINADGTFKWEVGLNRSMCNSAPVIGKDGTLYITSSNKVTAEERNALLSAVYPDGTLKWQFESQQQFLNTDLQIDSNGMLYFCDVTDDMENYNCHLYSVFSNSGGLDTLAPWPMYRHDTCNTGQR